MTTTEHTGTTYQVAVTIHHAYDDYILFAGIVSGVSDSGGWDAVDELIYREAAKFDSGVDWDAEARRI